MLRTPTRPQPAVTLVSSGQLHRHGKQVLLRIVPINRSLFSQTLGGVFLLVAFQLMSDSKTISDSSTKVLYGSFLGASVLGVVTLALLRRTPVRLEVGTADGKKLGQKQSHWKIMGKYKCLGAEYHYGPGVNNRLQMGLGLLPNSAPVLYSCDPLNPFVLDTSVLKV